MSKLNLLVYLNSYSDVNASNAPSMSNFKWARDVNSCCANNPQSQSAQIAPGATLNLFSGLRTLAQDGTTNYSISLIPLSSNTYQLSAVSGTLPNFRTPRSTGADATTQVTAVVNGPVVTFTSTGGTNFNLAGVQVGDQVIIGNLFNALNQGTWTIISVSSTSFSIENELGVNEGPITLGSGFASQIQIFSAAGVQIGDTLFISSGFSPASFGSYKITAVAAQSIQFYSTAVLPQQSPVNTEVAIYSSVKNLIYLESDSKVNVILNGIDACDIEPFVINNCVQPGVMLLKSTVYSLSLQNSGINPANIFFASVE